MSLSELAVNGYRDWDGLCSGQLHSYITGAAQFPRRSYFALYMGPRALSFTMAPKALCAR